MSDDKGKGPRPSARSFGDPNALSGAAPSAIDPSLSRAAALAYGRATADEPAAVQLESAGGGLLVGGATGKTEH